jgi:PAS domain S-box-containing protein
VGIELAGQPVKNVINDNSKPVYMHPLPSPDFQSLFESVPGLYLILLPDLKIAAVSDAYLQATMTKKEEIIGKGLFEVFPDNPDDPQATGVSNLRASLNAVLKSRAAHTMAVQQYDIRRPDGSFEERFWSPLNKPVLNEKNEVVYIIHRVEDVTEFVKAKRNSEKQEKLTQELSLRVEEMETEIFLRAQEIQHFNNSLQNQVNEKTAEIREVFERITDGFIALDKNFCYTYLNQKAGEITRRDPNALLGKNVWEEFPQAVGTPTYDAFMKAMKEQRYVQNTDYYEPLDLWQENHIYPSPNGLSVFIRDITESKRSERKINEVKDLSNKLIDSLPGVFYFFDANGKFLRWNKQFEEVTGYSAEEIATMHPIDFFEGQEKEYIAKRIEGVFEKGLNDAEASFLTKSGDKIPYYFKAVLLQYEGGPCLLGNGIDITERRKAEEKLEVSEKRFRSIIEQFPYPVVTYAADGEYTNANNAWEIMWNDKRENVKGYNIREDPQLIASGLSKVVENAFAGEVAFSDPYLYDPAVIGKTGNKKWMVMTLYPLKNVKGDVQEVVLILQDVTENKKAEEELKISEHKYKLLFESNPLPMWMLSLPAYEFIDVNNAALLQYGYTKEEFLKLSILDLRLSEDVPLFTKLSDTNFRGVYRAGVWRHKKKNGSIIFVDIITHDFIYNQQATRLVLANDITEKYKAEEKLKESYESIRQLTEHLHKVREEERAHMAREIHDELGQQLTVLKMDVSWLNKRVGMSSEPVKEKFTELLGMIDKTVKTVRRLASELRPTLLDDLGLVAAIEWHLEEFEKRSGIRKEFEGPKTELQITDSMKIGLFRILQESLTNVARHSGAQKVDVSLQRENGHIILKIIDDGKGFDAGKATNKTLGLLGMKERTQMMGGVYHISGIPGKGTMVEVVVPFSPMKN